MALKETLHHGVQFSEQHLATLLALLVLGFPGQPGLLEVIAPGHRHLHGAPDHAFRHHSGLAYGRTVGWSTGRVSIMTRAVTTPESKVSPPTTPIAQPIPTRS